MTNAFAMLRLLPMGDCEKDVEILALRHQIGVLERQLNGRQIRFHASDRAFLASLLHGLPLSQVFMRLMKKLDLPPVRLHDLRHCAATLSLAAGLHMKAIQVLLGHASFSLTADTYTSVLPQFEEAQAEAPLALVPRKSPAHRDLAQEPEEKADVPPEDAADVPQEDAA
ncbi:tyrosine-type recombinase/integrase [Streptomyces sp. NPDC001978]|uniref:tyrosine-type recombinase/integrase n=1 Tax=Streptomyces sp. NPDC001978 TaxID=3364627 RepID=UPI00369EE73D